MDRDDRIIRSIDDARRQVPAILKQLNANQSLIRAAAANPIFALEELGYHIPQELIPALDRRIRFLRPERERLAELERRVQSAAGQQFDLDDPEALEHVLFNGLKLPPLPPDPVHIPIETASGPVATEDKPPRKEKWQPSSSLGEAKIAPSQRPALNAHRLSVTYRTPGSPAMADVLEPLRSAHPIIEPLIEYRAIVARHAPFAPRELYDRIRREEVTGVTLTLRARVQRDRAESADA